MRIVSGKYKRRIITPPKNLPVRPTTDMAKESLFNILNNYIDFSGQNVLDLFSGTGNISYEFISRGAALVTSVDKDFGCVKFIKETAAKLSMDNLKPVRQDVFRFLNNTKSKYDIIFADPPYKLESIGELADTIIERGLLKESGWLIIEHPKEIDFSNNKYFHEHRNYGSVNFSLFIFK